LQRFCFDLQKPEIIQLPPPSASGKPEPCPHIPESFGESIGKGTGDVRTAQCAENQLPASCDDAFWLEYQRGHHA
jgi:hypothetical protein